MKDRWVIAAVAAAVLGAFAVIAWPKGHDHVEAGETKLEVLYPAPPFAFPDHRGQTVTLESLKGKVWVANFIFTTCRTVCPLLTAKMGQLQRRLEGVDARFLSFSVDPERDTPEALAAYARRWRPEETRWALLATAPQTLEAAVRGFRVVAQKSDAGGVDPILHSSVFLLVDGDGLVRGSYDSERPEQFALLEGHVRQLTGAARPREAGEQSGEALYHQLGCVGCHQHPELAPPLGGLAGARRELEGGLVALADAAYVSRAILVPQAERVAGYPILMPTYAGLLDDAAMERLVEYVLALPPEDGPAPAGVSVEVDLVCQMKVRATKDALHHDHAGKRYWFCSRHCQQRFAANPAPWVQSNP